MLTNLSRYPLPDNISEQLQQQYNKPDHGHSLWKFESIPVTIILVMVMSIVPILTISGNCLVVWAIMTQKCLQQVQNRLLISLAVADILVALIVMPFAIFMEVAVSWKFGFIFCDIWRTMDVMCCTASILHLCAIALDRYWAITEPFTYSTRRNKQLMLIIIATVWISSLIISLPPVTIWHGEGHGIDGEGCELIVDPVYIVYSAIGSFYGPLAAMFVIYARIYHVAAERLRAKTERRSKYSTTSSEFRHNKPSNSFHNLPSNNNNASVYNQPIQQKSSKTSSSLQPSGMNLEVPSHSNSASISITSESSNTNCATNYVTPQTKSLLAVSSTAPNGAVGTNENSHPISACPPSPFRSRIKKPLISVTVERKAANTLGIILGCFVLSWLPFFTLYIISPFVDEIQNLPYLVTSLVTWMGYFNSMANPIIYTIFNPDFRKAFSKIFKCLEQPQSQAQVPIRLEKRPSPPLRSMEPKRSVSIAV